MNKSEFLNELSRLLCVLQEEEVRDILEEYEQHINMKIQEGKTEQEVLADFGNVEELAEEILSAYHVKADFTEQNESSVYEMGRKEKKRIGTRAIEGVKNVMKHIRAFILVCFKTLWDIILKPFRFLKRLFRKEKVQKERQEKPKKGFFAWIGAGIKGLWNWFVRMVFGCLFLSFGLAEIILLLAAGILIVLMLLGYPVIGISLIVIGISMANFSITAICGIKMRRRAE